jgi:hypothetical protein
VESGPLSQRAVQQTLTTLEKKQHAQRWLTIVLGLLALTAVGGLIPFWIWVYFQFN